MLVRVNGLVNFNYRAAVADATPRDFSENFLSGYLHRVSDISYKSQSEHYSGVMFRIPRPI